MDATGTPAPRKIHLWRWTWIAFMVLATSVPYLVNWFSTPSGFQYTWILPPYPEDSLAYRAWSQQAAQGSLLFKVKYTALPHAAFLFHPFFLLGGVISSVLHCDIGVVHFVLRSVGVALFFVVFFRYIDYLELNPLPSVVATALVGISSGVGWLALKLGFAPDSPYAYPVDLNMPESSTFWSLLWNPLFPYSLALLVLSIHLLDRGTHEMRARDLWSSGLCVGLLALIHPYQVPLLFAFATLIIIFRTGKGRHSLPREGTRPATELTDHGSPITCPGGLLRFFTAALPFALYTFLVAKFHPIAALHSSQGKMDSRSVLAYVLGFGVPLFLALAGVVVEWRKLVSRYWPLLLWVFLSIAFTYSPFWFQTKFIFGLHVALCLLAGISVDLILARIPGERTRRWALAGSALLLLPLAISTRCYLLGIDRGIVRENAEGLYYIDTEMSDALQFLKQNSHPDDIVFATLSTSQLIPAFSGNTAVWGHWAMSVDREQRTEWVNRIFDLRSDWDLEKRRREFWGAGIRFIVGTGELRQWIDDAHPEWLLQGTDKVFENASVTIYRKRDTP